AAVEELPAQQQRDRAEVAAAAEVVAHIIDARIRAERERRLAGGARHADLRLKGAHRAVELPELGAVAEGFRPQQTEVVATAAELAIDRGALEWRVERAVQEEIHIAAQLRDVVARVAQLLLDGEKFRARPQHLVLSHPTVAVQRIADADVL